MIIKKVNNNNIKGNNFIIVKRILKFRKILKMRIMYCKSIFQIYKIIGTLICQKYLEDNISS